LSAEVVALLRGAERITAICHENPDADTLGAGLAIRLIAERLGKRGEVVCADVPPPMLSFMPGIEEVRRSPQLEPDVAVIVDAGDMSRTGSIAADFAGWLERSRIVNIDHHVSNPGYGAAQLIDPDAAATCEIIAGLLPDLGVALDAELATVLMAGIASDTRTFSHPNTTPHTLRVAADLVEARAPLSAINRALYVDRPYATLALWGQVLAGVEQRCDERIVHASLTLEMLTRTGTEATATEGLIDLLASVRTADISILFKEAEPGLTRVSVRTSARADAVAITSHFGGGGHARAAGCSLEEPLATARERVLAESERELARSDAGRR
jgi:bifunctional oligoribonuclease and PAP phosphatase NrnA